MSHRKKIYKSARKDLLKAMEKEGFSLFYEERAKPKPLDFGDLELMKMAASSLGAFHSCARKVYDQNIVLPQKDISRYLRRTEKGLKTLKNSDLERLAEYSFLLLCDGTLEQLDDEFRAKGDIRYGKIGKTGLTVQNKKVYLTSEEGICEDLAIFDLCRLLELYLKETKKAEDGVFTMIDNYEKENPLTALEKRALVGFLLLPYQRIKCGETKISSKRMAWYQELFLKEREDSGETRD